MSVTGKALCARRAESRNDTLEAELVAAVDAAINWSGRARFEEIFGKRTDEHVEVTTTLSFLERSAYKCSRCERVFVEGDVVHRRRGSRRSGQGWTVNAYCEGCVRGWHPSWLAGRRPPFPCAGGCGVLVSHWYWAQTFETCSRRCSERVTADRKRVHVAPRTCEACGVEFTPRRTDARYCSNACRQDAYRQRKAGRL